MRLAGALELGRAARAYLFELAGKRDPDQERRDSDDMPAAVRACVEAIAAPAYILDRYWNARAWNGAAARLFVGWLDQPGERNLLRFTFGHPAARSLICDWEARGRRLTAEFRADTGTHLDDPKLREKIAALRRDSLEFAQCWDHHGVLGREGGERTFNHPIDGFLRYQQVTFNLASQPDLKLTMLVQQET